VGTGPLLGRLRRMAGEGVTFHGWIDRERLRDLYRRSAALIVPNIEDFGMAAVESLACGTPVIGLAASGTADVVRPGREGELAEGPTVDSLAAAARSVLERSWDRGELRKRSATFSREQFRLRFLNLLDRIGFQVS
jgi:glycosyltransferase involved in cell wall biosynthesis